MERGSKERIIVPIIKKGRAPFVSLRIIVLRRHHFLPPVIQAIRRMAKIAANGTGKLPIQTMGAFLKKKVVVSMARPQQCG